MNSCFKCKRTEKEVKLHFFICDTGYICTSCKRKLVTPTALVSTSKNWNEMVSPKSFDDFIGQEPIKDELRTMITANKRTNIHVQHVLFSGGFGLGKTTLANIFASMIGKPGYITATNLKDSGDLPRDTNAVVVDEIHTIKEEEWLLTLMDKGTQTVIGATTTAGSLSGPLRSRFVSLVLQPYSITELQQIINGAANNLKYECPEYVSYEIAKRGKTVARIALFLFKRVYDRIVLNNYDVSLGVLNKWFKEMQIDENGLDNADRAYLNCLSKDRPVGIQNLSAMVGLDKTTLLETVEPYLLTHGFIQRTARGRILGDKQVLQIWN